MPRRKSYGQSALAGMLWDRILNGSPEKQAQKEREWKLADQQALLAQKAQLEAKNSELEAAAQIKLLADALVVRNPSIPYEQAEKQARTFIAEYGKQIQDQGILGAQHNVRGKQLSNEFDEKSFSNRLDELRLKNEGTTLTNKQLSGKILEDEVTRANRTAAENAESLDRIRKAQQARELNNLERANKAAGLTAQDTGSNFKYRRALVPLESFPYFQEERVQNPNFQSREVDIFGVGDERTANVGASGSAPALPATNAAPSAPAVDKERLKAEEAAKVYRQSLGGGSVINALPSFERSIPLTPNPEMQPAAMEFKDLYYIDPLTGILKRRDQN